MEETTNTGDVQMNESAAENAVPADAGQGTVNPKAHSVRLEDPGTKIEEEDLDKEFDRLIKGRYADAYGKRAKQMINRRFRETKELEAFRDRTLAEREEADRRGRAFTALGVASEYSRIMKGAEDAKRAYPSFDLERECSDRAFVNLIASGLSVKSAYEALHHGEIVAGAMQYAADRVAEAASRAAPPRPIENGTSKGADADLRRDVSKMSAAEIRDVLRRVERGEKIKF